MRSRRLIVVGGVAGGASAAARARRLCEQCEILVLDVRRNEERAQGAIPGSMHIPLDELRARANELPRDREIIAHCQSGQRSYFACRLLSQRGFKVRNLAGSWRTYQTALTGGAKK